MEQIFKVVLRYDLNHNQVRYFRNEEKADKAVADFEKLHPCKFANKYVVNIE